MIRLPEKGDASVAQGRTLRLNVNYAWANDEAVNLDLELELDVDLDLDVVRGDSFSRAS